MKLRTLTLIAASLLATTAQAQFLSRASLPAFYSSWGAKVGFAATATYVTDAFINGHELTEYSQDTPVGNFAAILFRLNSRTVFFQSGLGLSYNKSYFTIDLNSWDPEAESRSDLNCTFILKSLTVPFQVGYHIVNRPPYCLSAYTGPRLRFTPDKFYEVEYSDLDPYHITDTPQEFIVSWSAGLSVKIGRTFLDFEYEATINTISGPITDINNTLPAPDYRLDRRIGIMSFSYGILF